MVERGNAFADQPRGDDRFVRMKLHAPRDDTRRIAGLWRVPLTWGVLGEMERE